MVMPGPRISRMLDVGGGSAIFTRAESIVLHCLAIIEWGDAWESKVR